MKVTFEETLSRNSWLHKELMNSLTGDVITKAVADQFYDVKLLVNGVELEPTIFNTIMNNMEACIDAEAKSLVLSKLQEAENKIGRLQELIEQASCKIKEEFKLDEDMY